MTSAGAPALAAAKRRADKRMVAIVPGGFDEHAPQMRVAGFGDRRRAPASCRSNARRERGRRRPSCSGPSRKRRGIAELRGDGQRGEIVDAAEAAQALRRAAASGSSVEQRPEIRPRPSRSRATASSTARRYARCVCSSAASGQVCAAQPRVVPLRPRLLRGREAAAVPEQEFRQPMTGPQQIRADVFATAQQVAGRFFLLGRDVDRRQRPGAIQDGQLARIASVGLDPIARRGAESRPGRSPHTAIPCAVKARCSSKPHGPAS